MVLRKSFYIHWSAGRSPRVHEVNPSRDPSILIFFHLFIVGKFQFVELNKILKFLVALLYSAS